jgi:glycosyltransferase involved in cell wall biosynthesis
MNGNIPLKVLFLTWEFPPYITGGLGMACYGMVRALLEQGVEIVLVLPAENPCFFEMKRLEDANLLPCRVYKEASGEWHSVKSIEDIEEWHRMNPYQSSASSPSRYRVLVEAIIPHVDFDIVHAHDWLTFEAGLYAREVTGRPLVCHVHSTEYDRACGQGNERIHQFERIGLELADRVIAVSRFTALVVRDHYSIHPSMIRVVHNAYIMEESGSSTERLFDEPVVLFMGRMTCQKGPDIFLEVARRVLTRFPGVRFIMAGKGDMLHNLIHRSAYYGLKNRIIFTGFLNRAEVDTVLSISDIFVAPSVSDPFNITVLEAMSRGLAVLVSRQSGVTEVVRHVLTADHWDVDAMSQQIVSLLKNPARIKRLSTQGKAEAEQNSWHDAALKLKEVCGELLCST